MSLVTFFFKQDNRSRIISKVPLSVDGADKFIENGLVIDATTIITHTRTAEVTKNPVESGSTIADHINNQNRKVSLEGIISNHPLINIQPLQSFIDTALPGLGLAKALYGSISGIKTTNEPAANAFKIMEEIFENRQPLKVVAGFKVYENVVLTDWTIVEQVENGDSLKLNATFEEIRIATSVIIKKPKSLLQNEIKHQASKVDKGKKSVKAASKPNQLKATAFLSILRGGVRLFQ